MLVHRPPGPVQLGHVHQPFNDALWHHIQTGVEQRGDRDRHEADLADALDQLLRRTGGPAGTEHNTRRRKTPRAGRTAIQLPDLPGHRRPPDVETAPAPDWSESLDDLVGVGSGAETDTSELEGTGMLLAEASGYGLWDSEAEVEQW